MTTASARRWPFLLLIAGGCEALAPLKPLPDEHAASTGGTAAGGNALTGGRSNLGGGASGGSDPSGGSGTSRAGTGDGGEDPSGFPSCAGMLGNECQGRSCCESASVAGGTFKQGSPVTQDVTIAGFRLDAYEVTVGRFRNFASAYEAWRADGNPEQGAGLQPSIPESGWQEAWTESLPVNAAVLVSWDGLKCDGTFKTWVDRSGNEPLPINCVNWYVAFAFCVWDGGRLPTEAEWEYAAAGGSENRLYPWGSEPPDSKRALYHCYGDASAPDICDVSDILPVGSKPAGAGLYGQFDLAGSLFEWTLDWYAPYPAGPLENYAKVDSGTARAIRGGDWGTEETYKMNPAYREALDPAKRAGWVGLRCARALE